MGSDLKTDELLLQAILERPHDDAPRLILADWWEERDGNWQAGRSFTVHRSTRFGGCEMQAAAVRESFVRAVIANPLDDGVRLVFADWLEENGEPEYACFVRVQCELANYDCSHMRHGCYPTATGPRCEALHRRERQLLDAHGYGWCDGLLGAGWKTDGHGKEGATVRVNYFRGSVRTGDLDLTFRRGFVDTVACPLETWTGGACRAKCRQIIGPDGPSKTFYHYESYGPESRWDRCETCRGTGRVAGVGAALVACQPVTTVRVTNDIVYPVDGERRRHFLLRRDVPAAVWQLLNCDEDGGEWKRYATKEAALDDLSSALILLAKGGDA